MARRGKAPVLSSHARPLNARQKLLPFSAAFFSGSRREDKPRTFYEALAFARSSTVATNGLKEWDEAAVSGAGGASVEAVRRVWV